MGQHDFTDEKYERRTVCCDFDGVLHSYSSTWIDHHVIPDGAVPGTIEGLTLLAEHFDIVIHTTRAKTADGRAAVLAFMYRNGWPIGYPLQVLDTKVPALIYIDDRGWRFEGVMPTVQQVHNALPWNKKPKTPAKAVEYGKIDTLFERHDNFSIDPTRLKNAVIGTINSWEVTEKIDGTNVRIMLAEDGTVTFGGRSNNAQMPADLLHYLHATFTPGGSTEKMRAALWLDHKPTAAVLYGEGYGAGIQKGGYYRSDKAFRLFDVLIGDKWWLNWTNTTDVANKLGIKTVPLLGTWTLDHIVETVQAGLMSVTALEDSLTASAPAEGIVARPLEPLFDRQMRRIIIKLKTSDFKPGKR